MRIRQLLSVLKSCFVCLVFLTNVLSYPHGKNIVIGKSKLIPFGRKVEFRRSSTAWGAGSKKIPTFPLIKSTFTNAADSISFALLNSTTSTEIYQEPSWHRAPLTSLSILSMLEQDAVLLPRNKVDNLFIWPLHNNIICDTASVSKWRTPIVVAIHYSWSNVYVISTIDGGKNEIVGGCVVSISSSSGLSASGCPYGCISSKQQQQSLHHNLITMSVCQCMHIFIVDCLHVWRFHATLSADSSSNCRWLHAVASTTTHWDSFRYFSRDISPCSNTALKLCGTFPGGAFIGKYLIEIAKNRFKRFVRMKSIFCSNNDWYGWFSLWIMYSISTKKIVYKVVSALGTKGVLRSGRLMWRVRRPLWRVVKRMFLRKKRTITNVKKGYRSGVADSESVGASRQFSARARRLKYVPFKETASKRITQREHGRFAH